MNIWNIKKQQRNLFLLSINSKLLFSFKNIPLGYIKLIRINFIAKFESENKNK